VKEWENNACGAWFRGSGAWFRCVVPVRGSGA